MSANCSTVPFPSSRGVCALKINLCSLRATQKSLNAPYARQDPVGECNKKKSAHTKDTNLFVDTVAAGRAETVCQRPDKAKSEYCGDLITDETKAETPKERDPLVQGPAG